MWSDVDSPAPACVNQRHPITKGFLGEFQNLTACLAAFRCEVIVIRFDTDFVKPILSIASVS